MPDSQAQVMADKLLFTLAFSKNIIKMSTKYVLLYVCLKLLTKKITCSYEEGGLCLKLIFRKIKFSLGYGDPSGEKSFHWSNRLIV